MKLSTKTLIGIGAVGLVAYLGTIVAPKAVKAATALLVQDIDQPARAPFAVTVMTNAVTDFNYTPVTIPAGQRLVIQNVSITGLAQASPYVVPITVLSAGLNGQGTNLYYFAPPQNNQESTQYYLSQPTTIYADSLAVAPAYAGYTPTTDVFNVVITGFLISNP
jgi:hypothetical protein